VKASAVRARVSSYDLDRLPPAAKAQEFARQKLERQKAASAERRSVEKDRRDALEKAHAARRTALDQKQRAVLERHRSEREALAEAQQAASRDVLEKRMAKQPRGVLKFLARITGISFIVAHRQKAQDRARADEHQRQAQALKRRHDRELEEFKRQQRALDSIEKRERRSLETSLRRDQFRAAARQPPLQIRRPPPHELTTQQRENLDKVFARAANAQTQKEQDASLEGLTREFNDAVERVEEQREQDERLQAQRGLDDAGREQGGGRAGGAVRSAFNRASGRDRGGDPGRGRDDRRRRQRRFPAPGADRAR
jgi:hypothetical protein